MPRKNPIEKLPVPGPWQPAVQRAQADLASRLDTAEPAVTVTRVQEAEWGGEQAGQGVEIWLMAAGRTYRYRAILGGGAPLVEPA